MILPVVFAAQNSISNLVGNNSDLYFALTTIQLSVNPEIGANITYCTTINVTSGDADWNLTSFFFNLPDNGTTYNETDYILRNTSDSANQQVNASTFITGNYNYVNFTGLDAFLNVSSNGTEFNITYMLLEPINSVKLSTSRSGRVWTETWNITSSATNFTIENASLIMTPTYWYTRIGSPTSIQFNSSAKNYSANLTAIKVYSDLNLTGNMLDYGSGWSTLSIIYNGPEVDASSGKSSSGVTPVGIISERISAWFTPKGGFFILGGVILIGGGITLVVYLRKK